MKEKESKRVLQWLWRISGRAKLWVLLRTFVRIAQSLIALLYAHGLGRVIDAAAAGDRAFFTREMWLFALYTVGSILLLLVNRYLLELSKNLLDKQFRIRFFSQLLERDFSEISRVHNGEWMTRIISDGDLVGNGISQIFPEVVSMVVRVACVVIALQRIIPEVTLVILVGGLVMGGLSLLFRDRMKRYHKEVQKTDGALRSFLQERLYSLLVIHAFTQEESTVSGASKRYDALIANRMKRHMFLLFCNAALAGAMVTAQIAGVWVCGLGILKGIVGYGAVSTVLYLVNMLEAPLNSVASYVSMYYSTVASAERLMDVEGFRADMPAQPVADGEIRRYYGEDFAAFGLADAQFSYEDGEEAVLKHFSLEVEKGEFVAFLGASGCGKSTTLKLLMNLYPLSDGRVYRKDTDGSVHSLDASWRGLFAYVPQGNHLISGTIRESLTFGDPALMASEETLWEALKVACADGFVRELPEGLDSLLGERGSSLSEGQVQRLAVARALLSERPVLLLDEATSALDGPTEAQLLHNLRAMTDRTVLIITHREAALAICDKQIRFEKPHEK